MTPGLQQTTSPHCHNNKCSAYTFPADDSLMALLAVIVFFVIRCCSTLSAEGILEIKYDSMLLCHLWVCGLWKVVDLLQAVNMLLLFF